MRCITRKFERTLVRGAAVLLVGGAVAGCSSDVSRFRASDFSDGRPSANRNIAMAPASQPYPGDAGYNTAGLDTTATGSINRQAARPAGLVGGVAQQQPLPAPGSSRMNQPVTLAPAASTPIQRQQIAAPTQQPAPIAAARPQLDGTATGSVAQPAAPAGNTVVTVREGDTAYSLSRRFGVPASVILSANGLPKDAGLKTGQQIVIPSYAYSRGAPGANGNAPQDNTRTATREPVPSQREPQERLAVLPETPKPRARPDRSEASSTTANNSNAAGGNMVSGGVYTVASGDTLYGIARKTGASAASIKAANGLADGYLQIGQKLTIPAGGAGQTTQVASASKPVDKTTTSATTREPAPVVKASAEPIAQPAGGETQVAAVASNSSAAAPDSTGIGKLRWPVRGRIVSNFGSTSGSVRNDGIDISVPAGTAVKAAENGVVIYAGDGLKEFGNTVLVRHDDGMVTVYGHASALRVKRGEKVKRGQEIALSGMSGNADSPKLHFEVRKNATPVNPTGYLE
ncbi:peptidoglycan DD-metalloendopeptidase family protein [Nitratireductor soli]|uniref:peptidoglycan DD-metalloendopeptidase family protein n=1 Tax=Nitratireductor soli TaxID=1670619 RepID=UPI00065E07D8|nr:peptidoglycan DD-metalloendopeptidase family protein [Nitratireductor soli]